MGDSSGFIRGQNQTLGGGAPKYAWGRNITASSRRYDELKDGREEMTADMPIHFLLSNFMSILDASALTSPGIKFLFVIACYCSTK